MAYQDRKRRYFDQGDHNDWNDSKANIRFQNDFTNGQSDSKRSRDERLVEDQLPFELKEYVRSVADGVASMGGDQGMCGYFLTILLQHLWVELL